MEVLRLPSLRCRTGLRAKILGRGFALEACGFGSPGLRVGELVFSTSMTGYPESLTDPSYRGQILVYTHPMIGNYGVPNVTSMDGVSAELESTSIQVEGFIVAELPRHSHGRAVWSLDEWLRIWGVPGAYRVDTRWLVRRIRSAGASEAAIAVYPEGSEVSWGRLEEALEGWGSYGSKDYSGEVSPRRPITVRPPRGAPWARVSLLDCGVKHGILRELASRGIEVVRLPCDSKPEEIVDGFNGVVVGSGPGNPEVLGRAVEATAEAIASGKPVLGVCLGMQLIALSQGGEVYKLKYGHRGVNKPVVRLDDGRGFITTHNHGYAVELESVARAGFEPWLISPDDNVLEGMRHKSLPVIAVQFHPEGGPGPDDASWVFDLYASMLRRVV